MRDLPTRGVPDTVAEGMAELAREDGMSGKAFQHKLFPDAVAERSYCAVALAIASDPEEQAHERRVRARRTFAAGPIRTRSDLSARFDLRGRLSRRCGGRSCAWWCLTTYATEICGSVLAVRLTTTRNGLRPSIVELPAEEAFHDPVLCDGITTLYTDDDAKRIGALSPHAMAL